MCLFLLIAFLLPILSLVLQAAAPSVRFVLYGIEAASPSIAAVAAMLKDRTIKRFFREMFHREHLAMAVMLPVSTAVLTMLGAKLFFCTLAHASFAFGRISPTQFIIIAWALVAEEIGWRGYFEPLLRAKGLDRRAVPLIAGIVWGLWHYHFFLTDGMQVPVALFFISCIVESYLYSFFMDCTEHNLVSAMVYHCAWNFSVHFFAINPADNHGSLYPYIFLTFLEGMALLLLRLVKKRRTCIL
ncbi:MAG: CPBP family intramembrane metalloprotease [Oscillospiraceae bacterium]|nr:CPBP family intramembrane metalloprotease [Oscillospiraceae bacterium]